MTTEGTQHACRSPSSGERPSSDPALLHWTQLIAMGVAGSAALRAAAAEARGGRLQRLLAQAADRLERGESPSTTGGDASAFVAAMAAGPGGVAGSLGDYLAVRQSLGEMRRRTVARLWGGLLLIAAAAGLGIALQLMLSGSVMDLFDEFEIEQPAELTVLVWATWSGMLALLVLTAAMGLLLLLRKTVAMAERICDWIPLTGGALAAVDLAEISDVLARLLAAGHPYPRAFDLAASCSSSPRMRRWFHQGSAALRQGASMELAVAHLPISAGVLPALVGPLGPAPDQPDQAWRIAARSAYRTAQRRTERVALILPPVMAICAAATAWASLSVLTVAFSTLIQLLGAF